MASFWKVNQVSTSGATRYWDMIETMLAAGWTMPNAGDSFTMNVNQVTHGGTGTGGLDNTNAWVRLQDPAGGREFTIQRNTATAFTGKYSKADKFITGTPSATVTPLAADQYIWMSNVTQIQPATNSVHHCWASDVAPYPFYCFAYPVGGGVMVHLTIMDEIQQAVPGTDIDPVIILRGAGSFSGHLQVLATHGPGANTDTGMTLSGWVGSMQGLNMYFIMGSTGSGHQGYSRNEMPPTFSGVEDTLAPGFALRRLADSDSKLKGFTTNILATGRTRYSGDTYTLVSPRDKIYLLCGSNLTPVNGIALPWNGDIPIT